MSEAIYRATATAWGGRDGRVATDDNKVDHQLSIPKELGGDGGAGTNPEQLFAAGYAACFHSALRLIARSRKIDVSDSAVSVKVSLVGGSASGLDIATCIEAELPGVDPETARELLDAAHAVCPYSRATRGNVECDLVLSEDG